VRKRLKIMKDSVKESRRLVLTIVVATVLLAVGAITVISRQKAKATEVSNPQERRPPVTNAANKNYVTVKVAGRNVQVDSQTGQIKELTPEEKQKLAAGLKQVINQSTDGLVQVQHSDGSVSMDLEGRFQDVMVARKNDDGTLSTSCVNNPQAAGAFFGIDPQLIERQPNNQATGNEAGKKQAPMMPTKNEIQ
jgi:hypothetical protein